ATPASTPAAASSAAAEAVAAASSAAATTAGASSASAAATTAATASAAAASGPEAAAQGASGAAALGASAATPASAASDSHVWSGSIQAAPASGAAGASAQGAKGAPVTVSSLQQLLALKNRVLMALQQHGIGKPAQTARSASAGAPAAQGGAPVQNGAANAGPAGGQPEVSPIAMGAVAAIVVALLALFVRLLMRKRKKPAEQAAEVSPEAHEPTPSASAAAVAAAPVTEEPPVLHEPISRAGDEPGVNEAAPVEEAEFVPPVAPAEPEADEVAITPVPTPAVSSAPLEHEEALPPTLTETLHPATPQAPSVAQEAHATHELPHGVEPGEPQTLADAAEAAGLAAAAELGADALPPENLGAPRAAEDAEALARTLEEPADAQKPATPDIALDFGGGAPQAAQAPQAEAPIVQTPPITEAFERPPAPLSAPVIPSVPVVTAEDMSYAEVPIAFPHDAVEALGGLDLPLPPRIGEPVMPTEPLSTEPAATPEASARLASPFFEPPAPLAGEAIEAGTAGAGALAGLGAPRFGALTLDFDLNLPADSAEPLPVFTPEQLARIARNKLDLAHEYIALGDVSGARSLINEVIESNDPATRSDAQALLSTLAPLS
ncbi:fimbrial protein FimV, partial [Paraburkholderia sp. CNPSo 3274]|uniref:FimV/HubP family polar landmark protein n=1 Tax=Paraburkholderia sp. CNPSo 3274 TaxID=2940932 RepID=UPI0020B8FEA4